MVRLDWPRAPLILGLVLGPLAENYFFLSHSRYGWSWLAHPLVLVIFAIAFASAFSGPALSWWRSRRARSAAEPPAPSTEGGGGHR
jgi:TctA family transporter